MVHAPPVLKQNNVGVMLAKVRLGLAFLFPATELYEVAVATGVPPTPMSRAPAIAAALAEAWSSRWAE
jgi:hypothetical protein